MIDTSSWTFHSSPAHVFSTLSNPQLSWRYFSWALEVNRKWTTCWTEHRSQIWMNANMRVDLSHIYHNTTEFSHPFSFWAQSLCFHLESSVTRYLIVFSPSSTTIWFRDGLSTSGFFLSKTPPFSQIYHRTAWHVRKAMIPNWQCPLLSSKLRCFIWIFPSLLHFLLKWSCLAARSWSPSIQVSSRFFYWWPLFRQCGDLIRCRLVLAHQKISHSAVHESFGDIYILAHNYGSLRKT